MKWETEPLGSLCDIIIGRTPSRSAPEFWNGEHPWLSIADMNQGRVILGTKERITTVGVTESGSRLIPKGTVLLSFKLSIGKVAVAGINTYTNEAIAALPITSPEKLNKDFLFWTLRSIRLDEEVDVAAKGKTLNKAKLERLEIPLPPLDEQKRIAAVLDRADALRRQRQESLQLTEKLLQSVFIKMFGDPVTLPQSTLSNLLIRPLRNGLSPASGGQHKDTVFTLSAITRGYFNSEARKEAAFAAVPKEAARVTPFDFLICRGNGNLNLCGQGQFPSEDAVGVIFPDTIIAASIDVQRVSKTYFATLWNQPFVRRQIESGARTANGIHKVNQTTLENIMIPLPPFDTQEKFGRIAQTIMNGARDQDASMQHFENLFSSLQQRAFRGELVLSRLFLDDEVKAFTEAVDDLHHLIHRIQPAYSSKSPTAAAWVVPKAKLERELKVLDDSVTKGEQIAWSKDYFRYRVLATIVSPFSFADLMQKAQSIFEEPPYEEIKALIFEMLAPGPRRPLLKQKFDLGVNVLTNETDGRQEMLLERL